MWDLIADIGGTNMRFAAISATDAPLVQQTFSTNGPLNALDACRQIISLQKTAPSHIVIAAAGVVNGGTVQLTNSRQSVSEDALRAVTGTEHIKILNDFEAAAWSLATVTSQDTKMLQGVFPDKVAPSLIIGPGTGLGVGAMVWQNGKPNVISGEGGHVTLAPQSAEEVPYFEALASLWPEVVVENTIAVEAEAILSGTGIPRFYTAIANARGVIVPHRKAAGIFEAAKNQTDPVAVITVDLFRRYLGTVAGDLGLVFDARGGVFITGGVALSNQWVFDDAFLAAFNAGGRHSGWRKQFPVSLYHNGDFGLIGARNYLREN